jgi:hypothetical protein
MAGRSPSLEGMVAQSAQSAQISSPAHRRGAAPLPGSQMSASGSPASAKGSLAGAERKSFTLTLDLVGSRLDTLANTSQQTACYTYQRINSSSCSGRGIYNDLNLATRVDYLTGIPFSHEKSKFTTLSSRGDLKGARVFDGALVYRDTTIQNEAEHLLSLNGMVACFGLPSAVFFRNSKIPDARKTLVALCSLAGSIRTTNQTKSNHLLQTVTEIPDEINSAFEKCKERVRLNLQGGEQARLLRHLETKANQGWAFKPNILLIHWLANSFYTGTDTKPGSAGVGATSIRFIDFPYCICMGVDGTPHENFIRYFVKTYLQGTDQEKYKRFIDNSIELMTRQSQLICDILNMYVDWRTLENRCRDLGALVAGQDPNNLPFFDHFKTHGPLIVKCINFEVKADTLYPLAVAASRAVAASPAGLIENAQSFFSSFEGDYKAIIGRLTGRGSPQMRFNIHSGFFILKRREFLKQSLPAASSAAASAASATSAASAATAMNEEQALPKLTDEEEKLIKLAISENPASQSQAPNYDPNQEDLPPVGEIPVVENPDAALTELNAVDANATAEVAARASAGAGVDGLFIEGHPWGPATNFATAAAGGGFGRGFGSGGGAIHPPAGWTTETISILQNGMTRNIEIIKKIGHNYKSRLPQPTPPVGYKSIHVDFPNRIIRPIIIKKRSAGEGRRHKPRKTRKRNQRNRKTRKV